MYKEKKTDIIVDYCFFIYVSKLLKVFFRILKLFLQKLLINSKAQTSSYDKSQLIAFDFNLWIDRGKCFTKESMYFNALYVKEWTRDKWTGNVVMFCYRHKPFFSRSFPISISFSFNFKAVCTKTQFSKAKPCSKIW